MQGMEVPVSQQGPWGKPQAVAFADVRDVTSPTGTAFDYRCDAADCGVGERSGAVHHEIRVSTIQIRVESQGHR